MSIFQPVWPWNLMDDPKIIDRLFYTTSSFVHNFKSISEFKLELQSGNTQFRSKLTIFCPMWPWHLSYAISSFVHHFLAIDEFKLELQSRNPQLGSKLTIFLAVWPSNLTYDLAMGHFFYAISGFVHHFPAIGEFKLELQSGNAQLGSKLTISWAVWSCNLTDDRKKQ